ncbi:cyclic nucleotide-binding domain-containing protein [Candidatus Gracilibacteria bacterium]|nr:cyclic nucleotide-binding domain-containing protein [Candidatus Gracilibacteria bacterium]
MISLEILQKIPDFETVNLKQGETLFLEGERDNNIYIVTGGELGVYKYTSSEKKEQKKLATLGKNEIFGEASLHSNTAKESSIIADTSASLLKIDTHSGIESLLSHHPKIGRELFEYIIHLSNNRLNQANEQIVAGYKISQAISEFTHFTPQSIHELLQKIESLIEGMSLQYIEKHPVLENCYTLRYDSQKPKKEGEIYESLDEIEENYSQYSSQYLLHIGDVGLGQLIVHSQKPMSENTEKIISLACTSLSGILHRYNIIQDEKNKNYLSEHGGF